MMDACTEYAREVVSGVRVVGHSELLACKRHLEDLVRGDLSPGPFPVGKGGGNVLVAVNYHAWQFVWPDFMVFNDFPERDAEMLAEVGRHRCTLVSSKERCSDVVFDVAAWEGNWSSCTATWFALWLGCEPVVLCGMDCYQGEVKYCHPWKAEASHEQPLDEILRPWVEEGRHLLPNRERVEVVSGPLVRVFRAFHTKDF